MKPRKDSESDADYIARLEGAYAEVSRNNKELRKAWKRVVNTVVPAADQAGLIVDYAAEVTGMKGDERIAETSKSLHSLASINWHEDDITIIPLPELPKAEPTKFGGDAEMLLLSAIERIKNERPPWESWEDIVPRLKGTDPKDLDWRGIADEVYDAIATLEFSRGLLRLDMRSTMYDYCFERIQRALTEASTRQRQEHLEDMDYGVPF